MKNSVKSIKRGIGISLVSLLGTGLITSPLFVFKFIQDKDKYKQFEEVYDLNKDGKTDFYEWKKAYNKLRVPFDKYNYNPKKDIPEKLRDKILEERKKGENLNYLPIPFPIPI